MANGVPERNLPSPRELSVRGGLAQYVASSLLRVRNHEVQSNIRGHRNGSPAPGIRFFASVN